MEEVIRVKKQTAKIVGASALGVFSFIALLLLIAIAPLPADALVAQPPQAEQPPVRVEQRCHTVTPSTYNRRVTKYQRLTDKKLHRAKRKVCKHTVFKRLVTRVNRAERKCRHTVKIVTASEYGGRGDDNGIGYRGADLSFTDGAPTTPSNWNSFAELSNPGTLDFAALGGLPNEAVRYAHHAGVTVRSVKRDVGQGGGGLTYKGKVRKRAFDAWRPLARALRFSGLAIIRITRMPCRGLWR